MSGPLDRPNVVTKHEKGFRNSDMAPGVEPGWAQPTARRKDQTLEYLELYALYMAYIESPANEETLRTSKR